MAEVQADPSVTRVDASDEDVLDQLGLRTAPNPTLGAWATNLGRLLVVARRVDWEIGEAWLYGEGRWGEEAAQAVSPEDAHRCQTAAWVVGKFPVEHRRPELSFSHHRELAGLPEPARVELLDVAVVEGLSCGQLRSRVWARKAEERAAAKQPPTPAPEPAVEEPDENGEVSYGLLMPFVVVASKGGPYQDESFCAGWECAQLDAALAANPAEHRVTLRSGSVPQADLIAMRHGFAMVAEEWPDDGTWTLCTFTKS